MPPICFDDNSGWLFDAAQRLWFMKTRITEKQRQRPQHSGNRHLPAAQIPLRLNISWLALRTKNEQNLSE